MIFSRRTVSVALSIGAALSLTGDHTVAARVTGGAAKTIGKTKLAGNNNGDDLIVSILSKNGLLKANVVSNNDNRTNRKLGQKAKNDERRLSKSSKSPKSPKGSKSTKSSKSSEAGRTKRFGDPEKIVLGEDETPEEAGAIPPPKPPTRAPTDEPTTLSPTLPPVTDGPTASPTSTPTIPKADKKNNMDNDESEKVPVLPVDIIKENSIMEDAATPTKQPTSSSPTKAPTSEAPTKSPSASPTASPTAGPTTEPTASPTAGPTASPSASPTAGPTTSPSASPTAGPTTSPSAGPTKEPSETPSETPSSLPSLQPSGSPSESPQSSPSSDPSSSPSSLPSLDPSSEPSETPSETPSSLPSLPPSGSPSESPQSSPSGSPSESPTESPTAGPTESPTVYIPENACFEENGVNVCLTYHDDFTCDMAVDGVSCNCCSFDPEMKFISTFDCTNIGAEWGAMGICQMGALVGEANEEEATKEEDEWPGQLDLGSPGQPIIEEDGVVALSVNLDAMSFEPTQRRRRTLAVRRKAKTKRRRESVPE